MQPGLNLGGAGVLFVRKWNVYADTTSTTLPKPVYSEIFEIYY